MEKIYLKRTQEVKSERAKLEEKLNVKLSLTGRNLTIESEDPFMEYDAKRVLEAHAFGFTLKQSLLLLEESNIFRVIHIKQFTRKKKLKEVRARIIGAEGKTKRTIEEISGCQLVIKDDNSLGVIGSSEAIDEATTAITNLIRGSKTANVYHFLERMNALKKEQKTDFGLKTKKQEDNKNL